MNKFRELTLPSNTFTSLSSDGSLKLSTYTHCACGNPKVLQTFSPKNLYLNNLSYSDVVDVKSIEPVFKLPVNEALNIKLSLKVYEWLKLLPLKKVWFWYEQETEPVILW